MNTHIVMQCSVCVCYHIFDYSLSECFTFFFIGNWQKVTAPFCFCFVLFCSVFVLFCFVLFLFCFVFFYFLFTDWTLRLLIYLNRRHSVGDQRRKNVRKVTPHCKIMVTGMYNYCVTGLPVVSVDKWQLSWSMEGGVRRQSCLSFKTYLLRRVDGQEINHQLVMK